MKFKRLSDLSTDKAEIVAAIKNSKAGLIEVAEDSTKIRRDPAIPLPENTEESRKALEARTVYAKGFDKENTTLDELIDHFNETNPKVVSVQMRNWADKKGKEKVWHFKGSIFITFKSEEAATEFVETKDVKYKDSLLDIKFQKNYYEEKAKENEARKKGKGNKRDAVKEEVKEEKVDPRDDIISGVYFLFLHFLFHSIPFVSFAFLSCLIFLGFLLKVILLELDIKQTIFIFNILGLNKLSGSLFRFKGDED